MFTLGNKEAIVNSTRQYSPISISSVIPGLNELMVIPGFGTFNSLKLTSFSARRASDAQLDKLKLTVPSAADLDITGTVNNVPVVVHLRVNSLRQASESAIDFIKRGRPLILEIKIDGGDAAATVATKLYNALEELKFKFTNATLPFTWAAPAGAVIDFTATAGYFQINPSVTFLKRGDIFAFEAVTSKTFVGAIATNITADLTPTSVTVDFLTNLPGNINVGDTLIFSGTPTVTRVVTEIVDSIATVIFTPALLAPAAGQTVAKVMTNVEAVNDGKYLEENVRMSTPFTSDTYAIKPLEVPIIGAKYTMVSWEMDALAAADGGPAPHKTGDIKEQEFRNNRYTLYLNEDVCNGAGGQTDIILTWGLTNGGVVTPDDFKKADGSQAEGVGAAAVADFLVP